MNLLEVKELNFKYGNKEILKNLSFNIKEGSFTSIIGPNGSGKSTLLKNLNHIVKPSDGTIKLRGKDISNYSRKELAREISLVPQEGNIEYDFSVEDVVMMGRYPHKGRFERENEEDYRLVDKALEFTNTERFRNRSIRELSGGEKQRVLIARAIAQNASTIFLDEPTSNLDINHQIDVLNFLKKLNEENNSTIILVIHDINLAARYSEELILLNGGEILDYGKPEDIITKRNIEKAYNLDAAIDINKYTNTTYLTPLEII